MKDLSSVTTKSICGLDLGDRNSQICLCTPQGDVVEQGKIATSVPALARRFKDREPLRIALETGTHSPWVSRLLEQWGHEVIIANPRKVHLIGHSRRKNDRIDALSLADLASVRPRLLYPIEHISAQAQADRAVLLARDSLVRARCGLINQARGAVKTQGGRLPQGSAEAFARKVRPAIPEALVSALVPLLELIEQMSTTIRAYDRQIKILLRTRYPQAQKLCQQIRGVGPITALAYVLSLGDPHRFRKSRQVGAFYGLVPALRDSSQSTPQLHISHEGNPFVRRLLVQCAQYILGPFGEDSDLRRFGLRLITGGGKASKKRAVVAVARKLSVLMHRLMITDQPYQPLQQESGKLAQQLAA